jgi:transposase-like protein
MENKELNEILKQLRLPGHIIKQVNDLVEQYQGRTGKDNSFSVQFCPKCGRWHPVLTKGGKTKAGKQMYKCMHCCRRFVEDHGKLTYYSHKDISFWEEVAIDTLDGTSINRTHERTGAAATTIFHMRHKMMAFLEEGMHRNTLSKDIQMDETFLQGSHKGIHVEGLMSRNNGERSGFRGTSREKLCVVCGVVPGGPAYARSYNAGQMNRAALRKYLEHVERGSSVTTDDNNTYGILAKEHQVKWNICYDCRDHKAPVNLNAVNSFHSMLKSYNRDSRGIATKYLNRYCSMLSLRWNLLRTNTSEYMDEITRVLKNTFLTIPRTLLSEYKIYAPAGMLWRTV